MACLETAQSCRNQAKIIRARREIYGGAVEFAIPNRHLRSCLCDCLKVTSARCCVPSRVRCQLSGMQSTPTSARPRAGQASAGKVGTGFPFALATKKNLGRPPGAGARSAFGVRGKELSPSKTSSDPRSTGLGRRTRNTGTGSRTGPPRRRRWWRGRGSAGREPSSRRPPSCRRRRRRRAS